MTVQTPGQHGFKEHTDGAWDFSKPVQTRSERFKSTSVNDFPVVTGKEAQWKFSPVEKISSLLNDELIGERYEIEINTETGVETEWISRDHELIGKTGIPEDRGSANAWSHFKEALLITLSGEEQHTVVLKRNGLGQTPRAAHTVIIAKAHSHTLLIIENTESANLAENVEIIVEDGAKLTLVTALEWDNQAHHLGSHFATVGRDANLDHILISLGGEVVRVNPTVHLNSEGSSTNILGAYFADSGQHLEHHVFMDHAAPNTTGRVTYKGALQGQEARTVWIGDVLIRRNASATDSYEQNRNLVLSEGTRADSIPNLEIETGDISGAGHASTTGRFDEEHIFYLQSRGITEEEARKLVVRGFLLEVINKIGDEKLEERLQQKIEAELEQSVLV